MNESTLGYPATEQGEKEGQGRLHYISCKTVPCNLCSGVYFVFPLFYRKFLPLVYVEDVERILTMTLE